MFCPRPRWPRAGLPVGGQSHPHQPPGATTRPSPKNSLEYDSVAKTTKTQSFSTTPAPKKPAKQTDSQRDCSPTGTTDNASSIYLTPSRLQRCSYKNLRVATYGTRNRCYPPQRGSGRNRTLSRSVEVVEGAASFGIHAAGDEGEGAVACADRIPESGRPSCGFEWDNRMVLGSATKMRKTRPPS